MNGERQGLGHVNEKVLFVTLWGMWVSAVQAIAASPIYRKIMTHAYKGGKCARFWARCSAHTAS